MIVRHQIIEEESFSIEEIEKAILEHKVIDFLPWYDGKGATIRFDNDVSIYFKADDLAIYFRRSALIPK
jgi:hypothetical protein